MGRTVSTAELFSGEEPKKVVSTAELFADEPPRKTITTAELMGEPEKDSLATSVLKSIPGVKALYPEEREKFRKAEVGKPEDIARFMYKDAPEQGFMFPGIGGVPPSGTIVPGKKTQEHFKDPTKTSMIADEARLAAEYGLLGGGKGLKSIGKGVQNLLKRPGKIEALRSVERALPLDAIQSGVTGVGKDIGRVGGVSAIEGKLPLRDIKKTIAKTTEDRKAFQEIGKLSDVKAEQRLLKQTGTFKPPDVSRVPRKPGMDSILRTEELTGMNERVRRTTTGELGAAFETPIRMFEKLGGNAKQRIYNPIDDADLAAVNEFESILKPMVKRWKTTGADQKKIGKYLVNRSGKEGKKILQNMGKRVEPLSFEEKSIVKEMDVFYEDIYNRINEARILAGKEPMGKVTNYYTFFKQLDWLSDKLGYNPFQSSSKSIAAELKKHFIHPNSTVFKHAERRTKNYIPVDINAFDAVKRYGQSAYNHIYLSPQIAKSRELLKPIAQSMPEAHSDITKWLDFVSGIRPFKTPLDKQISILTKNNAMAILSYNLRSAAIQPSAIVNTVTAAGPIHTFNGVMDLLKQAGSKKARDFVWKNSNLPARKFDVLIDSMASPYGKAVTKAAEWGTKPLQVLDMLTANASWSSFYRKATKAMGMKDKEAFRYANDMVIKSQASGRGHHISPIQRSSLGKAATTLQTFVINDWGFLTQDVLGLGKNVPMNSENLKKVFYYIAATTGVNAIYEEGFDMSSPYGRPVKAAMDELSKDDPNYLELAKGVGTEIGERVPVVGGAIRYGSGLGGATLDTMKKALIGEGYQPSAIGDVAEGAYSKALGGDADISPYSLETLGKVAGIPGTSQARKMWTRRKGGMDWLGSTLGQKIDKKKKKPNQWGVPK